MDEREWLEAADPHPMLNFLRHSDKLSERKTRLFGVACCRRVWALLTDDRLQSAVLTVERLADSRATAADRKAARRAAQLSQQAGGGVLANRVGAEVFALTGREAQWAIPEAARLSAEAGAASRTEWLSPEFRAELKVERAAQSRLLHDLFGPLPFRPLPAISPSVLAWDDGCVVKLATSVYEERDFSPESMGILADALEEAGVTDAELLGHLRSNGPH